MRMLAMIGLFMLGWTAAASVSAQELGDFPWGASPREISAETGAIPDSQGSGTLIRRETTLGENAIVTYRFTSGGLSAVGIQWDSNRFAEVEQALDAKYPPRRCDIDAGTCQWASTTSEIRLISDRSLGLTLLVYSEKPRD